MKSKKLGGKIRDVSSKRKLNFGADANKDMKCRALSELLTTLNVIVNKSGLFMVRVIGKKSHNNLREFYNSSG